MMLHGDCLDLLPRVADGSVDMVFADLPYGVTANKWDSVIPFEPLWAEMLRVGKRNAAFVFTATQPFTTALVNSQPKLFRHDLVWEKSRASGFMNANKQPLKAHEQVLVFACAQPTYNAQKTAPTKKSHGKAPRRKGTTNYGIGAYTAWEDTGLRHPRSVQYFDCDRNSKGHIESWHPTQKPVALLEWLIRTYSNSGDTVLDPTMGSGTTGVACLNTDRKFIGIEKDADYFAIAKRRIAETHPMLPGAA